MHGVQRRELPRSTKHIRPEVRERYPAHHEGAQLHAGEPRRNSRVDIHTGVLTGTCSVSG